MITSVKQYVKRQQQSESESEWSYWNGTCPYIINLSCSVNLFLLLGMKAKHTPFNFTWIFILSMKLRSLLNENIFDTKYVTYAGKSLSFI